MSKPHKHCEVIKAWADGAAIQYLNYKGKWVDCQSNDPEWIVQETYRVKPEPVKTLGYRRYVNRGYKHPIVSAALEGVPFNEDSPLFVRWIDTEWQYETVDK